MTKNPATGSALFAVGFLSIGTQICLFREFMMVFSDQELTTGMLLSVWLLCSGAGSLIGGLRGRADSAARISLLLAGFVLLPTVMIPATSWLRILFVPAGGMAGPAQVLMAGAIVEAPFCLLSGCLFTRLSIPTALTLSGSYAWESAGGLVSGALVNFLLIPLARPGTGHIFLVLVGLAPIVVFIIASSGWRWVPGYLAAVLLLAAAWMNAGGWTGTGRNLWPGQEIFGRKDTHHGRLVVTRSAGQFNFFGNGHLLFSSGNSMANEENVHYAMLQHPHPQEVLLIGGGFSGTLDEISKYGPLRVDYIEQDPALLDVAARYTRQLTDPSVTPYAEDARRFIREHSCRYDVVLVNLPPPASLQLNRFYSREFMEELSLRLKPGAVAAWSLPGGSDYAGGAAARINSLLFNTLRHQFRQVVILPGMRNYFLASDRDLSLDIPALAVRRGIRTEYVNGYYLDADQIRERSAYVMRMAGAESKAGDRPPENCDLRPLAVWAQTSWWLGQHQVHPALLIALLLGLTVLPVTSLNPVNAGLYSGGFTLAATEVILIFGFQVLCGNLFRMIGVIILVIMAGLAAGAAIRVPVHPARKGALYRVLQGGMALAAIAIPYAIVLLHRTQPAPWAVYTAFFFFSFIPGLLVGMEYSVATRLRAGPRGATAARNFSADLFGSAAGALSASLILIPLVGLVPAGLVSALLNGITLLLRTRQGQPV